MKRVIMGFFVCLLMVFAVGTVGAAPSPNLVEDENGCFYWKGDKNYLAVMQGFNGCIVCAKMDTCRFSRFMRYDTIAADVVMLNAKGNIEAKDYANFFPDGHIRFSFNPDYSNVSCRIDIGNVSNVIRALVEAAS